MKDAYYFPHDSNARLDVKMIKFRAKHGYEGYGIFWAIIEVLRDQAEWKLSVDDIDVLALSIQVDIDKLNGILNDLVDIKLLKRTTNHIYSESLTRRMQYFEERKNTYRNNGKKGGRPKANENLNHNLNESYSKPTGYVLLKQNESKTKAVKVSKESKGNKDAFLSFIFDTTGKTESEYIRNGTSLIQWKIILWHIFESYGYDKKQCEAYYDRIQERNWCNKDGDPYTPKMLTDELAYYHKRGWLKGGADATD
jgi:hypothetical protein